MGHREHQLVWLDFENRLRLGYCKQNLAELGWFDLVFRAIWFDSTLSWLYLVSYFRLG